MTIHLKTWIWPVLFAICLPKHSRSQPAHVLSPRELLPVDATSCIFAGKETRLSYVGATGPVAWTLSAANRTIRQGTAESVAARPGDGANLTIALSAPNLQPGVTLPTELRLTWQADRGERQQIQPVTMFSPDPFSVRHAALLQAKITLFDATGDTAEVFDRHKLPHSRVQSLAAIDQRDEGIIVVGEGMSFRKQPKLLPTLTRAAARGVSVLCLAPADGEFEFPEADSTRSSAARIAFEQASVVRRYDKRFDLLPTLTYLAVESRRANVIVRSSDTGPGWSWFAAEYRSRQPADSNGQPARLILCGLSIIRDWETTPVPRYLLVHLLAELAAPPTVKEKNHAELSLH
jgi:hypothetical protein